MDKPICKLVGENGNAFNIIGLVSRAIKSSGQSKIAKEFKDKAFACGSYDELLCLAMNYVEVK